MRAESNRGRHSKVGTYRSEPRNSSPSEYYGAPARRELLGSLLLATLPLQRPEPHLIRGSTATLLLAADPPIGLDYSGDQGFVADYAAFESSPLFAG